MPPGSDPLIPHVQKMHLGRRADRDLSGLHSTMSFHYPPRTLPPPPSPDSHSLKSSSPFRSAKKSSAPPPPVEVVRDVVITTYNHSSSRVERYEAKNNVYECAADSDVGGHSSSTCSTVKMTHCEDSKSTVSDYNQMLKQRVNSSVLDVERPKTKNLSDVGAGDDFLNRRLPNGRTDFDNSSAGSQSPHRSVSSDSTFGLRYASEVENNNISDPVCSELCEEFAKLVSLFDHWKNLRRSSTNTKVELQLHRVETLFKDGNCVEKSKPAETEGHVNGFGCMSGPRKEQQHQVERVAQQKRAAEVAKPNAPEKCGVANFKSQSRVTASAGNSGLRNSPVNKSKSSNQPSCKPPPAPVSAAVSSTPTKPTLVHCDTPIPKRTFEFQKTWIITGQNRNATLSKSTTLKEDVTVSNVKQSDVSHSEHCPSDETAYQEPLPVSVKDLLHKSGVQPATDCPNTLHTIFESSEELSDSTDALNDATPASSAHPVVVSPPPQQQAKPLVLSPSSAPPPPPLPGNLLASSPKVVITKKPQKTPKAAESDEEKLRNTWDQIMSDIRAHAAKRAERALSNDE